MTGKMADFVSRELRRRVHRKRARARQNKSVTAFRDPPVLSDGCFVDGYKGTAHRRRDQRNDDA